jgi:hypothetical protein
LLADGACATRIAPLVGHTTLFFAKVPSWFGLALVIGFVVLRAWPVRDGPAAAAVQGAIPAA